MTLPVGVIGGGGFGRALARAIARSGREVRIWSRSPRQLGPGIERVGDLQRLAEAELLFFAVPSPHLPGVAHQLGAHLDGRHLLVHVNRGLLGDQLETLSQHLRHSTPCRRVGALAGPLLAAALEDGSPAGAIVGSRFPEVAQAVRDALGDANLRLYETTDVIGCEVASAFVGLLTLGAGYARQIEIGPAAMAVFLTRGMAEAGRIATSLGGDATTLAGLAGFGDLLAALAGDERPETRVGAALARGVARSDAEREGGAHIEGIAIAERVVAYAERARIEVPISSMIARVLAGQVSADDVIAGLMARRVRTE